MYDFTTAIAAATTVINGGLDLIDTSTLVGGLVAGSIVGVLLIAVARRVAGLARRFR